MFNLYKHKPEPMDKEISKAKLKILNQKDFEKNIIQIMTSKSGISMIDAIVHYCEKNNIEIETAAALVTAKMKTKIEKEAIVIRMVESTGARLPLKEE
jgi:hypothetical protein